MAQIGTQKIQNGSDLLNIPIYELADVSYPAFRIQTSNGVGCYDLVAPTVETPLRISTPSGIMGVNLAALGGGGSAPDPGLIDYANYNLVALSTVLAENTDDYMLLHTDGNGNGLGLPFVANIGDTLECDVNVDITQGVDDVISVRLWNLTQNKWITTNMKTGTVTSGLHNLKNTFTLTSGHLANGDQLELRIVQSWKNSTHDIFKFKVMKDSRLTIYV